MPEFKALTELRLQVKNTPASRIVRVPAGEVVPAGMLDAEDARHMMRHKFIAPVAEDAPAAVEAAEAGHDAPVAVAVAD